MTCDKSSDNSVPDSVIEMMPRELAEFVMERLSTAQQQPASLEHILYTLMENNNMDNLDLSECINVIKENCLLNDNNEPAVNDGKNNTTPTSPPCTITTASDAANLNSSCETISNLSNHCQRHNIGSSNLENLLVVKQEPQDDNSNWLSPNKNATSNDFIMFNACNSFIQEVRKSRRFPCSRKNGRKTRHTNRLFDNQTTVSVVIMTFSFCINKIRFHILPLHICNANCIVLINI